jgi:hypothetical protein
MARQFNTYYVGGSPRQFPDRYRFVASATHIDPAAPPTLVIFGANDHLPERDTGLTLHSGSHAADRIRWPHHINLANAKLD